MSRLTEVIKQVKENTQAWIYDNNGNIADNVICGDVLEWLEDMKQAKKIYRACQIQAEKLQYLLDNEFIELDSEGVFA